MRLNIYDLLYHEKLIISEAAVKELEQLLGPKKDADAGEGADGETEEKVEAAPVEAAPAKPKRVRKPKAEAAEPAAPKLKLGRRRRIMRTVWDIIKSPVITEKALVAKEETQDTGQLLTFRVDRRATKPEIKSAVESIFQVKVDRVRTINFMGKMARRGRFEGRKPSWKKAYVTLKQGEKPVDYGESI